MQTMQGPPLHRMCFIHRCTDQSAYVACAVCGVQVVAAYDAAQARRAQEEAELEELVRTREQAYLELLAVVRPTTELLNRPPPRPTSASAATPGSTTQYKRDSWGRPLSTGEHGAGGGGFARIP